YDVADRLDIGYEGAWAKDFRGRLRRGRSDGIVGPPVRGHEAKVCPALTRMRIAGPTITSITPVGASGIRPERTTGSRQMIAFRGARFGTPPGEFRARCWDFVGPRVRFAHPKSA